MLIALDKAIALSPRGLEAYDLKAERLADMGRYDEAKLAATPAVFENDPPMILQGRAAWVEARRGNLPLACREMQALVTLEPTYYWGWQQLAEWYNEAGKSADFLEATEKLVELRPDNPIALAMRGEARLQNENREGGKEDLRDAQHLEPGYSYPGMLLFDAHLQDEEYPQARAALAVLEEHIAGGGRPYVLARYTQLAARTKDEDAAAEAFAELLTLQCDSTWPINSSATEIRQAGWPERVDRLLRDTLEKADEFHPWVLMAWLESKEGTDADPETKLRLVRRVTDVHPRYAQAYDVMAELLTRLTRYDEALRACHPKAWGDRPPLILRGRAAWIAWQRGDRAGAIGRMREIVQSDADYYLGLAATGELVRRGRGEHRLPGVDRTPRPTRADRPVGLRIPRRGAGRGGRPPRGQGRLPPRVRTRSCLRLRGHQSVRQHGERRRTRRRRPDLGALGRARRRAARDSPCCAIEVLATRSARRATGFSGTQRSGRRPAVRRREGGCGHVRGRVWGGCG